MRLIDADALKERIRRFLSIRSLDDLLPEEKAIVQHIDRMLPVDAVPVVKCRECKYAHMTYDGECKYCDIWFPDEAEYIDGDYFCASGERKDGNDD